MATKKTVKKPKYPTHVTIRQIESTFPCEGEYFAFLRDFKSNHVPNGLFDDPLYDINPRKFKTSAYGPDDPISLLDILNKKSSGDKGGVERVVWILWNVGGFKKLALAFDKREDELIDAATPTAIREVLAA